MEAPLALYRRYRPETFAEVIGQDHVTAPLRAALTNNRVNHAYLFSGPRGCGKTTSARILARCLNCEQGPTDTPCGVCRSCTDLARGGPGSIDVIEIDAASHGGVDDARDLRERAFFAPVSSRYKVYIIDEAHMVTPQGFNALLKLVEEPPEHLKFVFATTEPDKVIGTIRSRTHHYPFRLIPPRTLSDYLSEICAKEDVRIDPAALPLVVRAGGGSARDTLSVLDQLMGGAGPDGVTYELATGLLGYTPDSLLDEVVDAFAAGDGRTVFGVVDKVIETGQDPRRFTEDLLRRLRDLVIIAAVPDAPATGLIDVPQDQGERLTAQAARFGRADLSRSAELVADGLTELKGATAPRLLLELICARVLLPGADHGTEGLLARLDRIEKRMSIEGTPSAAGGAPARAPEQTPEPTRVPVGTPQPAAAAPAAPEPATSAGEAPAETRATDRPAQPAARQPGAAPAPDARPEPVAQPATEPAAQSAAQPTTAEPEPAGRGRAQSGRGTPAVAGPPRGGQAQASLHLDPAQPERPGRRRRREDPDGRPGQRRRAQLLQQRRQRGDPAAGRDRRDRPRLAGRVDRRPVGPARRRAAAHGDPRGDPRHPGHPGHPWDPGGLGGAAGRAGHRSGWSRRAGDGAPRGAEASARPGDHRAGPWGDPGHPLGGRPTPAPAVGRLRRGRRPRRPRRRGPLDRRCAAPRA